MNGAQMPGGDLAFLLSRRRPRYERGANALRVVDVFAGCGAMTLGVAEAARAIGRGLDVRLAVEANPEIAHLYAANFVPATETGLPSRAQDIFNGSVGERLTFRERRVRDNTGPVDVLVGGPPCQGHSDLNNHTRRRDPKNRLYLLVVRAAEVLRPAHLLIENVPAITQDAWRVVPSAIARLSRLGYMVSEAVVPLHIIGVPQTRKRHVLVASREVTPDIAAAVRSGLVRTRALRWAIRDLLSAPGDTEFDLPSSISVDNEKRATWLLRHNAFDLPNRYRPPCHRDKPDHRYKSMYGRLRWDMPAQTITTGFGSPGQGRYLHPHAARTLTPHEAARIQFFPDWFNFRRTRRTVLAEAIGNAVPAKLTFTLIAELLRRASTEAAQNRAGASW
jgi:DNA (cytosine-5)-methyltransferase 1